MGVHPVQGGRGKKNGLLSVVKAKRFDQRRGVGAACGDGCARGEGIPKGAREVSDVGLRDVEASVKGCLHVGTKGEIEDGVKHALD